MAKDVSRELKQLKKDYYDLEEKSSEERQSLQKVISIFSVLASTHENVADEIREIKELIGSEDELPLDLIDEALHKIKGKVIQMEGNTDEGIENQDPVQVLTEQLFESCRMIRRITNALLEDLYPMTDEMKAMTDEIRIDCKGDLAHMDFKKPADDLIDYLEDIKQRISEDFRFINETFITFLEHVKELEKTFNNEFGGEESRKKIEYFDMKINHEVGSIAESFSICSTISEVRSVVVEKLKNIRTVVSKKKEEDLKKVEIANENIANLKNKIIKIEKEASKMAQKAELFQEAAMKDGLTGLFNRKALDIKLAKYLEAFIDNGAPFSIVFFDVDKFKDINDTFGHVAGDKVLEKVSQCLMETFRKDDFIARYGGDEFVVAIEGLSGDMARERIVQFRNNLKKRRFVSYKNGEIDITVSAGIASVVKGDTLETLYKKADKSMYDVKKQNA